MERAPLTPRRPRSPRSPRHLVLALAIALLLAAHPGPAAAGPPSAPSGAGEAADPARTATVMTRNLYLGAELDAIVAALAGGEQSEIVRAATYTWNRVVASDPAERMAAVADEIAAAEPHAVGLQEVTEWTTYDFNPQTGQLSNRTETYDFLDLLLAELAERGVTYREVPGATARNFTSQPIPVVAGAPFPTRAVQLLDRDVIIVRDDVKATNARNGNFDAILGPPDFPIAVDRGWGRRTCGPGSPTSASSTPTPRPSARSSSGSRRSASCSLPRTRSPSSRAALPTVYAGDFNSDAPPMGSEGSPGAYKTLLDAG